MPLARLLPASLRVRLVLLVIIALAPAFAVITYTGVEQRDDRREHAEGEVLRLAQLLGSQEAQLVEGARQLLASMARLVGQSGVDDLDAESCGRAFAAIIDESEQYANMGIADADGEVICSALPAVSAVSVADRAWHTRAVETRSFAVGEHQIGRITGRPTVNFGYPVLDGSGNVAAVVFAALELEWLHETAAGADLPEGAAVMVLDRNGIILARYPEIEGFVGRTAGRSVTGPILTAGEGTAQETWTDGVDRVFAFTPLAGDTQPGAYVTVGVASSDAFARANQTLLRNLLFLGGAAVLAMLAAWFVGEWFIVRGVRALIAAARRIARGDLGARSGIDQGTGELAELGLAFDGMALALQQREQERRRDETLLRERAEELSRSNEELERFAYVASHDLQEPLRMVSNYTQLLARRYGDRLDADAREFIDFAVDGATRMQQLINDLLTYSRVGSRGGALEPVDADAVLGRALANLRDAIDESGAVVTKDALPTVLADHVQLGQVFQNLIGNAIKFRGRDAPRIHVSAQRVDGMLRFAVRDNGIGIDGEYADRIFVLFQRLHGRERYPGTGIGLAVCKKVVERHGGGIWFESSQGRGTTFYFTCPAAAEAGVEAAAPPRVAAAGGVA